MSRRHERCRLLVSGKDEFDRRVAKRFYDVEVLLTGYAEDALDALVRERGHQQVGSFGHGFGSTGLEQRVSIVGAACCLRGTGRRGDYSLGLTVRHLDISSTNNAPPTARMLAS